MPSERQTTQVLARLLGIDDGDPPRAMLVFAHPDDETVGATTLLPRLRDGVVVYVTDGAPRAPADAAAAGCATREDYAGLRHGELIGALDAAGVPLEHVVFLGCVDQETPRELVRLTLRIEVLLREHAPDIVLTHPYEGGHPDHDSTAFAVHTAVRRLEREGTPVPLVAEFASYHAADAIASRAFTDRLFGRRGARSGTAPEWEYGAFLPAADRDVVEVVLRPDQAKLKQRLIGCHGSQRGVLRHVPVDTERFRVAPDHDFWLPPHAGRLLYEHLPWGVTGAEWRSLARHAAASLRPDSENRAGRESAVR